MNSATNPALVAPVTSQAANVPSKIAFSWAEGRSASTAALNKVLIPNATTREVMAETEAGANVVNCCNLDELFDQLDA